MKTDVCSIIIWDRHNLGVKQKEEEKLASKERATEVDLLLINTLTILEAPTLAKSFASPPLAAMVNDLRNDNGAPIPIL